MIGICQVPDDETMTAAMESVAKEDNVRTETLGAFSGEAMQAISQRLG